MRHILPGGHFLPGRQYLTGGWGLAGGSDVPEIAIREASQADIPEVRAMLREYVAWIGLDLAFQEVEAEIDGLPGEYAPPRGALFVASANRASADKSDQRPPLVGMIGLRPLDGDVCEMKRLFVRPEARGHGLAKQLIGRVLAEAHRLRYAEIRLDTLPMMGDAQALYVALGFEDIPAYYDTPIAGTRFMALRLRPAQAKRL
jgi:ribosomal protein S18 acetylase RimI-like enzyme